MFDSLFSVLHTFLKQYSSKKRVLLALSGGPDSLCLFYLLTQYRQMDPTFDFAVAHVDHGWRKESGEEALYLKSLAEKHLISFYLKTLDYLPCDQNLEAFCREERLRFFANICSQYDYEGVMLAHQKDDVAETILKRVFEGVTLAYLGGLGAETFMHKIGEVDLKAPLKLWRPLLTIRKKEIEAWLELKGVKGFIDYTNFDPKYMRGRFRTHILPLIRQSFGKNIESALCHLNEESRELRLYLDEKVATYLSKIQNGVCGSYLDLNQDRPTSKLENKYLIRRFCEINNLPLSYAGLNKAVDIFLLGASDKRVSFGKKYLYIDSFRLFISNIDEMDANTPLQTITIENNDENTIYKFGKWNVEVLSNYTQENHSLSNWKQLWLNQSKVLLPPGRYDICFPKKGQKCLNGQLLADLFKKLSIPTFLKRCVPVLSCNGLVYYDFLTGVSQIKVEEKNCSYKLIYLSYSTNK